MEEIQGPFPGEEVRMRTGNWSCFSQSKSGLIGDCSGVNPESTQGTYVVPEIEAISALFQADVLIPLAPRVGI